MPIARRGGAELPPGPRTPAVLQTVAALRDRQGTFERLRRRYGDPFTVWFHPGPQRLVLFSDPDAVKEIFAGDPVEFSGALGNEMLRAAMGDRSVMLNDGADHRTIRRYLMPAFSPAAVAAYRPLVERAARAEVDGWPATGTVPTLERMSALTLEVMLEVVLGRSDPERLAQLRPRVLRLVEVDPVVVVGWLYPRLRALPPWRGHAANLRGIDALVHGEIEERRARTPSTEPTDGPGERDLLDHLLAVRVDDAQGSALPAAEIRDQVVTLLLAGYETTASTLSWTLHELGRDAEQLQAAQRAADVGDDDHLEACVKETMRLHPIIDYVARTLRSPQTVGGWDLPAGVTVCPAILLTHHDAEHFPEPGEFRPERHLAGGPAPHTHIPFGGGVRRCVGAAFALMEGVVALGEVLRRYDVVADRPSPVRLRNITNVPGDGAPVRVRERSTSGGTLAV